MSLNELSGMLWRERQLLELLVFKLEEEELILTSGRTQWLGHATREVECVLDQIRTAELGRSMDADEAARELGVPEGSSLKALADRARPPWDDLLTEHRAAFVSLTDQIDVLADGNRDLLATSHLATRETLMGLQESVRTYDPRDSTPSTESDGDPLLDQARPTEVFGPGGRSVFAVLDTAAAGPQGGTDVGGRYDPVTSAPSSPSSRVLELRSQLSAVSDIDLPRVVVELQMQEIAHLGALGATTRVLQPTLMDFLR